MKSDLERIVALAELQLKIEDDIADLEAQLKERNAQLRTVSQEDLPDLMMELGLTEFKLANGKKVKIKEDFTTSIAAANWPRAVEWLEANNYAGIIKSVVTAKFGVSEKDKAELLVENLSGHGVSAELKQAIHPQTLKAFVRERMEASDAIPMDVFGVNPFNKSVIS